MAEIEKKLRPDRLAEIISRCLPEPLPAAALSRVAGGLRQEEYFHPGDFPASGGLFFTQGGELDVSVRASTAQGAQQPNFLGGLPETHPVVLCPEEDESPRVLTYTPAGATRVCALAWDDLLALLKADGPERRAAAALMAKAGERLAQALAAGALRLPEGRELPLPELAERPGRPRPSEADFSGVPPVELAAGGTWRDPAAAGAFIARGQVSVGEGGQGRMFCRRGAGLQATWGHLVLRAESPAVIYPVARERVPDGGALAVELARSLEALAGPLARALDRSRDLHFREYLRRTKRMEKGAEREAAARLGGIQRWHRRMPLIRAHDAAGAWSAAVQMVAGYYGRSRSPRPARARASEDPVSDAAARFGMRSRAVTVRPGDLLRLGVPLIAAQKDETPLALEPAPGGLWAHDPLKGSHLARPKELEDSLPGLAYELTPGLGSEPACPRSMLRLAFRGESGALRRLACASALVGLLGLLTPVATDWVFGFAVPAAQKNVLNSIGLALLSSAAAVGLFSMFRAMLLLNLETLSSSRVSAALWSHLFRLPVRFFRKYRVGGLSLRMQAVDMIQQMLSYTTVEIGVNALFSLAYVGVMFWFSSKLTFIGLGMALLALLTLALGGRPVIRAERELLDRRSDEQSLLYEMVRGVLTVRTSAAVRRLYGRWLRLLAPEMEMDYKSETARMWIANLYVGIPALGTLLMYWIGGDDIMAGRLTLSQFLGFNVAFGVFIAALIGACQTGIQLTSVGPLWELVRPILEAAEERPDGGADPGELKGGIEVSSCSFRYAEGSPEVIRGVSFAVRPGEFVALTGPSGSGKTTLIRLLLGFDEPTAGHIFYDRHDLRELDPRAVRRQVGVVLQQGELLPGSIKENLRVNAPLAGQEELEAGAKSADIHEEIMAMPMGYETLVSEGGAAFSGGQRQRLAIARALVPKPRILFFDEATSALDNRSQSRVERSLDKLSATRVVVAHRLSTIENADRIIVLVRGRIAQEGSFKELMAQKGVFKEMVERQQL
ncbi:MAG: ATP-binding cassette domain-containing protein [Elusimicrobiota bacterium]